LINKPNFKVIDSNNDLTIKFSLHDGFEDEMVLDRFYLNDFDKENRVEKCNFLGNLKSNSKVGVALTGCIGQDDVLITILFQNPSVIRRFQWSTDGRIIELVRNLL